MAIEDIHPARQQPRKSFDDERLEQLAESIRSQGIIQPLVVRRREAGGFELIAGERRWRAAQRAGLHELPVVVREVAEQRAFEMALVENLQRADLNPIEEAEGYQRLMAEFGYTQESLAGRVGKDRSTVANSLRLLKLPPPVRDMVIGGAPVDGPRPGAAGAGIGRGHRAPGPPDGGPRAVGAPGGDPGAPRARRGAGRAEAPAPPARPRRPGIW